MPDALDIRHMRHALRLAERGLGRTWPNPSVGAVIVKDGAVVGTGVTAQGGRPHAETQAILQAADKARGATLYVSLEPCSHQGKTPPCAQSIITAGICRVVAGCTDPNPKVAGKGFVLLRAAGIEVTEDICKEEARVLNEGFFSAIERGRPFVILKLATSLDGKITTGTRDNKWITGEESRRMAHALRASHDAIMTGIGTVLADDPQLICRLPGREADSPQRVVMDKELRIPAAAKLLPAWIFTSLPAMEKKAKKAKVLEKAGSKLFPIAGNAHGLSLAETLGKLAQEGVTRLMVEAGSALAGSFMREGLVDRIYWFRAPATIGAQGMPALSGNDVLSLSSQPHLRLRQTEVFGEDVLEVSDQPRIYKGGSTIS